MDDELGFANFFPPLVAVESQAAQFWRQVQIAPTGSEEYFMFSKFLPSFKVSPLIASAAIAGAAMAMAGMGASTASASVIYSDSFTGGTANLDGASPTVDNGTSTVWTAGSQNLAVNGAGGGVAGRITVTSR